MSESRPTVAHWRPASEPPEIPAGTAVEVLVAVVKPRAPWPNLTCLSVVEYVCQARRFLASGTLAPGEVREFTGFLSRNREVRPIGWAPMPLPPEIP